MKENPRILIVEDDAHLLEATALFLSKQAWSVATASNGQEALHKFLQHPVELVVLDVMMPVMDGWELCMRLRQITDVPIIMLTARGQEYDRIKGIEMGADDYLVKPFSLRELTARVAALLRLSQHAPPEESAIFYDDGDLLIDGRQRQVLRQGTPVALTSTERRLLFRLASNFDHTLSGASIVQAVWGPDYPIQDDLISLLIWRLRQKIEPDPAQPVYLIGDQNVGYRLARQPAVPL